MSSAGPHITAEGINIMVWGLPLAKRAMKYILTTMRACWVWPYLGSIELNLNGLFFVELLSLKDTQGKRI